MRRSDDDMQRLLRELRAELRRPRTMEQLIHRFDVSRGTLFRWFDRLADAGTSPSRVGVSRPTRYQIAS